MPKYFLVIIVTIIMLTGCLPQQQNEEPDFPEVEFTITKQEVNVGEAIVFDAYVSVAGEPITDADRVEFEIWLEDQEDAEHESIVIEHSSGGHYILEKGFEKEGTYYIYYHVDTMGLHLMNKYEFLVK